MVGFDLRLDYKVFGINHTTAARRSEPTRKRFKVRV